VKLELEHVRELETKIAEAEAKDAANAKVVDP
jgi:hypothetical protein